MLELVDSIRKQPNQTPPQNIPLSGVVRFIGREQELETLHQQLQQRTDRANISVITGMGGIGKTELALQYANFHRQQDTYSGGICWLQAGNQEIGTQIIDFARPRLKLSREECLQFESYKPLAKVAFCWEHLNVGDVLIVLDNLTSYQTVQPYLPSDPRFKILITTRLHLGLSFKEIEVKLFNEEEALQFLTFLVSENRILQEIKIAQSLCKWVGYLPLGLELVGRYLARKLDLSLAKMEERLHSKSLEAKALIQTEAGMTASLGVKSAFELSWEELDAPSQQLAYFLSLFGLAPIPWLLVQQCFPDQDEEELEEIRDENLIKVSLLKRIAQGKYQLHQLIREFFRLKFDQDVDSSTKSLWAKQIISALNFIFPSPSDWINWSSCNELLPHAKEATELIDEFKFNFPDAACLPNKIGRYLYEIANYKQAQKAYLHSLQLLESMAEPSQVELVNCINNLVELYDATGQYRKAQHLAERAVEISKNFSTKFSQFIARSLYKLAMIHDAQDHFKDAESYYKKALTIQESSLAKKHQDTAKSLNNLGKIYYYKGYYSDAESFYQRALEMRQEIFGQEHSDVAESLDNLGVLYSALSQHDKALPLHRQALEIRQIIFGKVHPDVGISLNNIAGLYESQRNFVEAEKFYRKSLEIFKESLDSEHPKVATAMDNLASVLYINIQDRRDEIQSLYHRALEIRKKNLGPEHTELAVSFNNLGFFYHFVLVDYKNAESYYKKALQIWCKSLGANHTYLIGCWRNYAVLLQNMKRENKAEQILSSIDKGELGDLCKTTF